MPVLQAEIENGGNYYSAFSTIYNIGKIIIESGDLSITDYFVDILINWVNCLLKTLNESPSNEIPTCPLAIINLKFFYIQEFITWPS